MKIENLSKMVSFFDFAVVEKISVDAVKHNFIAMKIDHMKGAIFFGQQVRFFFHFFLVPSIAVLGPIHYVVIPFWLNACDMQNARSTWKTNLEIVIIRLVSIYLWFSFLCILKLCQDVWIWECCFNCLDECSWCTMVCYFFPLELVKNRSVKFWYLSTWLWGLNLERKSFVLLPFDYWIMLVNSFLACPRISMVLPTTKGKGHILIGSDITGPLLDGNYNKLVYVGYDFFILWNPV